MNLDSPSLNRAAHHLDRALDELDQVIIHRNDLEKRLDRSSAKLAPLMKALDRRWDRGNYAAYRRAFAKHAMLQKSLAKAQRVCTQARQDFHDKRDTYDAARRALAGRMIDYAAEMDHLHRCQGALNRTLAHLVDRLKSQVQPDVAQPAYAVREGAYDYIPFEVLDFLSMLIRLDRLLAEDADYAAKGERYRPVSFLEVGCGPGHNLLIARESKLIPWSRVEGFDINPDQLAIGRRAFGLEAELQVADAMTFDFSDWDVVFSYRPFSDNRLQRSLEAHIVGSMRPSAYLLAPLSHDLGLYRDLTPTSISRDIWKKTGAPAPG